jgi:protein-L-isoaspartate(D-aspartate) O-methyltransferase
MILYSKVFLETFPQGIITMRKSFPIFLILFIFPAFASADIHPDTLKYRQAREKMVKNQIKNRGISDTLVLDAMMDIPRHYFVARNLISKAYKDHPVPIGEGQTISQPYIVALMTERLKLTGNENVLEIGTGSGYQAAILAKIAKKVTTIEIRMALYEKATETLKQMGLTNIETLHGDGYFGWKGAAPFDCIMITAAVDHIPPPLLDQLKNGGRLILPLGNPLSYQHLALVTKKDDDYTVRQITGVLFVPMTGYALKGNVKRK